MNNVVKDVVSRVTSRKFLLAVSSFTAFLATGNAPAAVAVVLGYFGVNGASEIASKVGSVANTVSKDVGVVENPTPPAQ